jgi:hypothetical protein
MTTTTAPPRPAHPARASEVARQDVGRIPVRCAGCGNAFTLPRWPSEATVAELVTGCCTYCPPGRSSGGLQVTLGDGRALPYATMTAGART